jgi:hypothetical protein
VQFRAESFNISNTPNSAFGGISQSDPNYTPLKYQFALKAHF